MEGQQNISVINTPGQSGDAMFFDGFEDGLFWQTGATNGSGGVTRDTTQAYEGGACMKLRTGDTAPTIDDYTIATKYVALGRERYIEAIFKWMLNTSADTTVINFSIQVQWGGEYQSYYFVLDTVSGNIVYFDNTGTPIVINDEPFDIVNNTWYNWRMVIDRYGKQYIAIETSSTKFDITGGLPASGSTGQSEHCYILVYVQTKDTSEKILWVDNVTVRGISKP